MKIVTVLLATLLLSQADQGTTVVQKESINLKDVAFSGQLTSNPGFLMEIKASCFGTNLRNVPTPLVSTSDILVTAEFRRLSNGQTATAQFRFPATVAMNNGEPQSSMPVILNPASFVPQVAGGYIGNTVLMAFGGVPATNRRTFELVRISFEQDPTRGGTVDMPTSGPVNSSYGHNYSSDGSMLYVRVSFPGAAGSCGSYYSPLMIFFSEARTQLTKMVKFQVRPAVSETYWPEGGDWALLAHDKNANGRIDDGTELFGADDKGGNGFEALRSFDSNKDGVINAKDKRFKLLKLWLDKNGDAKTDKGELVSLKAKDILEISLSYKLENVVPLGDRGEYREKSKVKTSKGDLDIIDVWFGTAAGGAK